MFSNYQDESKPFHFNSFSLDHTPPLQRTQQFQTPHLAPNIVQPTNFLSQENWMKIKRHPCLNSGSFGTGNWSSSSSQFQMHGISNVMEPMGSANFSFGHGSDAYGYYRNYSYGQCNSPNGLFGGGINANEVNSEKFGTEKAFPYHGVVGNGFNVGNGNGSRVSVKRKVGVGVVEMPVSEKVHRRMIRNRESAARSRARKLAHNAQQQREITKIEKENELLRRVIRVLLTIIRMKRKETPTSTSSRSFSAPL